MLNAKIRLELLVQEKLPFRKEKIMSDTDLNDALKAEYDLSKLRVRKVGEGRAHMIVLDSDVSEVFQDSESVNGALRFLIKVTRQHSTELSNDK